MIPLNAPVAVILAAALVGYLVLPPIEHAVKWTGHKVCHTLTLGHKCR